MNKPVRPLRWLLPVIVLCGALWFLLVQIYEIPIVLYHHVGDQAVDDIERVTSKNFRHQMEFFRRNGFRVLSLEQWDQLVRSGKRPPFKSVVLTFDDGYEDNYTVAAPILREYGFPATIFLVSEWIGRPGYLTLEQLARMKDFGITYGSHSVRHTYLPDASAQLSWEEIAGSRVRLEQQTGSPIDYFAYPIGGFNEDVKAQVREAGYRAGFTTNRGHQRFSRDLYQVHRIRVDDDDLSAFTLWWKLSGYYHVFRRYKNPV